MYLYMNVGNYFHKILRGKIWQVKDQTTLAVVKSYPEKKIILGLNGIQTHIMKFLYFDHQIFTCVRK